MTMITRFNSSLTVKVESSVNMLNLMTGLMTWTGVGTTATKEFHFWKIEGLDFLESCGKMFTDLRGKLEKR